MTNPPRYHTDRPDHRPDSSPYVGQPYPDGQTHVPSHLRYDWRYAQQPTGSPYDAYYAAHQPITVPVPMLRPKKSRRGAIVAGAVAVAVVGGGIGATTIAITGLAHDTTATKAPVGQAPVAPHPAAKQPAGSVEQVAAKVMPSVVKLQIDMGGQGDEGSGIVLSADGLILINNHVVAPAAGGDQGAEPTSADSTDGAKPPRR
jgi:putative serine protease PepD